MALTSTMQVPHALFRGKTEGQVVRLQLKRGDKIIHGEAQWVHTKDYLTLAALYPDYFPQSPMTGQQKDHAKIVG